ncbi:HNH endonuclease signature motif containing protein [Longimicrobium sp.]|uniref:HNH endonuclease signature motif containing protein n=1 Tax=Longimicrobium sp. TaxID=2029185 RepID=UPI003B3B282A
MSKQIARKPQSYLNEQLVSAQVPVLLRAKGFDSVAVRKPKGMKLVQARTVSGGSVTFWLKQGWTDTKRYSAIQFGMISRVSDPRSLPDDYFVDYVAARTASAKDLGATHALMVHMVDSVIQNYVAVAIDDVAEAYRRQIRDWPQRARNTKTPTLWFEDSRDLPDSPSVQCVTNLEIPLEKVSGVPPVTMVAPDGSGSRKVTVEVERRLRQQSFRVLVGNRCGWRCVVSGTAVREVLEAAHLPGRDWRVANQATDGILLRADLHRLLDQGIAEIRGDEFIIRDRSRAGEYLTFSNRRITVPGR